MLLLAADQKELEQYTPNPAHTKVARSLATATVQELQDEKKSLTVGLMRLQQLAMEIQWVDWATVYDQLGSRLEIVKAQLEARGRIGA